MKSTGTIVAFAVWRMLASTVIAVPLVPGWEENPVKYTLEIYAICDFHCATTNIDPKSLITDIIHKTTLAMVQLNLELVLVGLDIWNEHGWTNWTQPIQEFQSQFDWLGRQIDYYLNKTYFDGLILFTGIEITIGGDADVRGVHKSGCMSNSKCWGVVCLDGVFGSPDMLVSVLAHELGHGLNMDHDKYDCPCPLGQLECTMAQGITVNKLYKPTFSDCSMDTFKSWVNSPNGIALRKPVAPSAAQVQGARCGNGVIDEGEQCDCGQGCLPAGCCNCCKGCMLVDRAQCASGKCCDSSRCKFHDSKTLCRKSRDSFCDEDDYCSGDSAECTNSHKPDWVDCTDSANEDGYCAGGFCNTVNVQCRFVWDRDYKAAPDTCFSIANETNYNDEPIHSLASYDYKCQTLICSGDKSNEGLPLGRNPQRTRTAQGEECLTGRYLEMERGLLGMSGTMIVEDGTKCGPHGACFDGKCTAKAIAIESMHRKPIFQRTGEYCGNGKVERGEDCDCGHEQCPCCDLTTCQMRPADSLCLGSCGLCTGKSSQECIEDAPLPQLKMSDFKICSGNTNEMCFDGECVSLRSTCAGHFWNSRDKEDEYKENVGSSSVLYNSGGFFVVDVKTGETIYEEYRPGEDDGTCGTVHCSWTPRKGVYYPKGNTENLSSRQIHPDEKSYPVKQFQADRGSRVLYYQPDVKKDISVPNVGQRTVSIYYPLLAKKGTPCTLPNNVDGYCRTMEYKSNAISSITYYYSKCVQIPNTPYSNRYRIYPFN